MKMPMIARGGITFRSRTRRVFTDVIKTVRGSSNNCCERSYADTPKSQKCRIHVSKDQRKAMVESYVNKYRASNEGKFPTASAAVKQVGGSFYLVRNIVQELKYKSKTSPLDWSGNLSAKDLIENNKRSTEVEEASSGGMTGGIEIESVDQKLAIKDRVINEASGKHLEAEGGLLAYSSSEKNFSKEIVEPTILSGHSDVVATQYRGDAKEVSHPCLDQSEVRSEEAKGNDSYFVTKETKKVSSFQKLDDSIKEDERDHHSNFVSTEWPLIKEKIDEVEPMNMYHPSLESVEEDRKRKVVSEYLPDFEGSKPKAEQYQYPEEKFATKTSDAESPKQPTLWGNLKSIAYGIINTWRKL